MIRRGPNIKLPDLDILNDAQPQEIDETWIDSKSKSLMMHSIISMCQQK